MKNTDYAMFCYQCQETAGCGLYSHGCLRKNAHRRKSPGFTGDVARS